MGNMPHEPIKEGSRLHLNLVIGCGFIWGRKGFPLNGSLNWILEETAHSKSWQKSMTMRKRSIYQVSIMSVQLSMFLTRGRIILRKGGMMRIRNIKMELLHKSLETCMYRVTNDTSKGKKYSTSYGELDCCPRGFKRLGHTWLCGLRNF